MNWMTLITVVGALLWVVLLVRKIQFVRRLQLAGVEATGRIIRQQEVSDTNNHSIIYTVSFTTQTGRIIEGEAQGNRTNLEFFDGEDVALRYDPAQPTRFLFEQQLLSTSLYWPLLQMGVALAAGALAVSLGIMRK